MNKYSDLFGPALECCGNFANPGLAVNLGQYINFSQRETTQDQARIEDVLNTMITEGHRVLHIGVGNSRLAQRFAKQGAVVEGITVSDKEQIFGESLNIPGYRVHLKNKYSREFVTPFKQYEFDFIIDNNLAAFACCKYHLYTMFENFLWCLKSGGKILTDQRGMDWALASPSFILDFEGLTRLEQCLPVSVSQVTDMVYAIESLVSQKTTEEALHVYALRRNDGTTYIESFSPS